MASIIIRQNRKTWTLAVEKNATTQKIASFEDTRPGRTILALAARQAAILFLATDYDIQGHADDVAALRKAL